MKKLINFFAIIGLISTSTTNLMNINTSELTAFNINDDESTYVEPQSDVMYGIDENSYVGCLSKDTYTVLEQHIDANDDVENIIIPWIKTTLINKNVTIDVLKKSLLCIEQNWSNIKFLMNSFLKDHDSIEFVYSNNSVNNIRGIDNTQEFSNSVSIFSYKKSYDYNNALTLSYAGFASANDFLNSKSTFLLKRTFEVYIGSNWKWHKWNTNFQNKQSVSVLKPYLNKSSVICEWKYLDSPHSYYSYYTDAQITMSITDNTTYKDLDLNFHIYLENHNKLQSIGAKMFV